MRRHRPRYYTTAEAAQLLGLSRAAVTRRCRRGRYRLRPGRANGSAFQIVASDVEAELRRNGGGD